MDNPSPVEQFAQVSDLVATIQKFRADLPDELKRANRAAWRYRRLMFFALVVVIAGVTNIATDPSVAFWQGSTCALCFFSALYDLIPAELALHRARYMDRKSAEDLKRNQDRARELLAEISAKASEGAGNGQG